MNATGGAHDLRAPSMPGRPSVAFDGRLDNRDELLAWLDADRALSDAELMLRAYLKSGADCVKRAIGDFAFAVWDPAARRLFCARDVVGVRPFYYRMDAGVFRWSVELPAIARAPSLPQPDEATVAEYLSGMISSRSATLFAGISRLPPAHALVADEGGVRVWKYWDLDARRTIVYARDDEYEAHFAELFTVAVTSRLRAAPSTVGIMLSGGIDSASILAVARRAAPHVPLRAYSTTFPGSRVDESAFIADVLRTCPVPSTLRPASVRAEAWTIATARQWQDVPAYPNGSSAEDLLDEAARHGCRVMLTGLGGGEWLGGSDHHGADLLRRGRLRRLVRQVRADQSIESIEGMTGIVRAVIWPLLAPALQRGVRRARRLAGRTARHEWIPCRFAARTGLDDRLQSCEPIPPFPTLAQRDMYRNATSGAVAHGLEACARTMAAHGLEGRYPFHDRRLIEFALALPEDQRWRGREHKSILRRAMAGVIPESVRARVVPYDYGFLFVDALVRHVRVLARPLRIAEAGWVDAGLVAARYEQMCRAYHAGQRGLGQLAWWLWMVAAIEMWFTTVYGDVEGGKRAAYDLAV